MKNSLPPLSGSMQERQEAPEKKISGWQAFFSRFDWFQIVPVMALLIIGAFFVYGIGQQVGGIHADVVWKKQLIYTGIGLAIWLFFIFFDYRWLAGGSIILYPVAIILLISVLFFGIQIFGARRWFSLGIITVQPSEIGKLAVLLSVSWVLSLKNADINKPLWALLVAGLTALPVFLILKEPDLGTALVLIPVTAAIAFVSGLKIRWIITLLLIAAAAAPVVYSQLKPYQKDRIQMFLDPESDPLNRGWNALQAEMAVGSGGLTGKGYMQSTHCAQEYLPSTVANSDFIFPVIAEETGFLGTVTLLLLYGVLFFSILRTAMIAPDPFGRNLCVGIATLLTVHTAVNIGMCIRILPITGLPLPLVSYGGTFMVAMLTYLGIAQSVYAHRKQESFLSGQTEEIE